jgi:hypothetical protein
MTYKVRRDGDQLLAHLTVRVRDDAPLSATNQRYHGFLRVYAPKGAQLTPTSEVKGDLGDAPDGPYSVFGTYIDVEPQAETTVSFDYELPPTVTPDNYQLTWIRQAGTPNDHLTAALGHTSFTGIPTERTLRVQHNLGRNPIIKFLRGRAVLRRFFR